MSRYDVIGRMNACFTELEQALGALQQQIAPLRLLAARVFSLPEVEKGQEHQAFSHIAVEQHVGQAARDLALEMQRQGQGKVLDQFNNLDNPYAHFTTTGPEIWRQTDGRITHFVSSMGTTGTITGVSRFLREQAKPVSIIGLQPEEGSSIPGIRRWPQEYMPGIFNAALVDEVLDIHQQDAENTMRQLAVQEGIFCGVSSGGAVAGALRIARANPGAVVVAIICDRGDRYLSTGVFGEEHFSQGAGI